MTCAAPAFTYTAAMQAADAVSLPYTIEVAQVSARFGPGPYTRMRSMADTTNLTLPLLAASQAQKHVTVNEALTRLDGAVQLRLRSRVLTDPPATVARASALACRWAR